MKKMENGVEVIFNELVRYCGFYNKNEELKNSFNEEITALQRTLKLCYDINVIFERTRTEGKFRSVKLETWNSDKQCEIIAKKDIF